MGRGNLYTRVSVKHDRSIELKVKLQTEFNREPRRWRVIRSLQEQLKRSLTPKPKGLTLKQEYGMFAWKVEEVRKNENK